MFDSQDFFSSKKISSPKDTETPISPSSSVGSFSPVRSTTPPPNYLFNESIFAELDNSLWITSRPLGIHHQEFYEQDLRTQRKTTRLDLCRLQLSRILPLDMPPKRTSTSAAPAMTQAAIRQLITDGIVAALEAQATAMANANNPNMNIGPREIPVAKEETTKNS
ncbi:hypothetical protein Tco_1536536 [Tanacetum coccineum]